MEFELLGLGFAVSKTIENGNGIYIFIWYTGISNNWDWDFEKNSAEKWDRDPPPLPLQGPLLKQLSQVNDSSTTRLQYFADFSKATEN